MIVINFFKHKGISENLGTIELENLFISKYMPTAPGDYVKVYILGLKYSQSSSANMFSNEIIAKTLKLSEKSVMDAWSYWEEQGIIKIYNLDCGSEDDLSIEFLSIREINVDIVSTHAETNKYSSDRVLNALKNPKIANMFEYIKKITSRLLSSTDMFVFLDWIDDYNFTPELVLLLVEDCYSKDKKNLKYMSKVAKTWHNNGVNTMDKAKNYLERQDYVVMFDKLTKLYGMELAEDQLSIFLDWVNDYRFTPELVTMLVEDCFGRGKRDQRYLNSVAARWHNEGVRTIDDAKEYSNKHKEKWQKYSVVLRFLKQDRPTTMEEEMMYKWFYTYGYNEELVLRACEETVSASKPLISNIDRTINKWYENGIKSVSDIQKNTTQVKSNNQGKKEKASFNNFKNREYDAKAIEDMLLKRSRGELSD